MRFSDARRRLLARTIMDLAKVQAAAAFATTFFKEFPFGGRVLMGAVFFVLVVGGFAIEPETNEGRNG